MEDAFEYVRPESRKILGLDYDCKEIPQKRKIGSSSTILK
jgi:hypothetical protein